MLAKNSIPPHMGKEVNRLKINASIGHKGGMIQSNSVRTKFTGQAFAEMALILPMLLLLVIGAIELGRVFYAKIVITNAAREGAYYLSMHRDDGICPGACFVNTIQTVKDEANNSGMALTNSNITAEVCTSCGEIAKVTIQTSLNDLFLLNLINSGFGLQVNKSAFPISTEIQMVMQ